MSLLDIFTKIQEKNNQETIKLSYYVIDYCKKNNFEITNLKLIKLLYFINIEYMLNNNGLPMFDEEFLAWRHGPVLQSVYDFFCLGIILPSEEKLEKIVNEINLDKKNIMDKVLENKASKTAWSLVEFTHVKNGPWEKIYNNYRDENGICKEKIPNKLIYEFYKGIPYEF